MWLPPVREPVLHWRTLALVILSIWVAIFPLPAADLNKQAPRQELGIVYTNERVADVPWSIHIVKMDRSDERFTIQSVHAGAGIMRLGPLSTQVARANRTLGNPVAAINGDFFNRNTHTGVPRGLQISDGEVLSAPTGRVTFWIDVQGQPYVTNVFSQFHFQWPNGTSTPCGLNEDPRKSSAVLYTPAMECSIGMMGGLDLVLEQDVESRWLPLQMGEEYRGRVREIHNGTNSPVRPGSMILSLSQSLIQDHPAIKPGDVLKISTFSIPSLRGVKTAIGGGPVLVRNGIAQDREPPNLRSYSLDSFLARNPRSAIGWNKQFFFFVEVDGRQKNLSDGMTLEELSAYMIKLGCDTAVNLDGGGSSTLWFQGKVMNSPSDGRERDIANGLIIVEKPMLHHNR